MKTVLIFSISCWECPYPALNQASIATWDSVQVDGIKTIFYRGNTQPHPSNPKIITVNAPESLYDMGRRNLLAFDWALKNESWDYMARVNASCYVRKKPLLDYCQTLPEKGLFQGVMMRREPPQTSFLWGGAQYIITRDVIQALVDHKDQWNHTVMEDQAMSWLVRDLGIPWNLDGHSCTVNKKGQGWFIIPYGHGAQGGEFNSLADAPKTMFQNFIRVKQDLHREVDIAIMRELFALGI